MLVELLPSKINIHNYTPEMCQSLEYSLNAWNKAIFSVTFSAYQYDEADEILTIPRGYDLESLYKYFPYADFQDKRNDHIPYKTVNFKCINQPREKIQADAIKFLAGEEYFDYSKDLTQKMLCLATGKGKTYCLINYLSKIKKLGMIIVDQDTMIEQWCKEALFHTDLKAHDVYYISGRDSINTLLEFKRNNKDKELPFKLYIASHRTLAAFSKDAPELLDNLFKMLKIGVKVFDEAHVEWRNICNLDFNTNVSETIYLTATPNRSKPYEDKVFQNMFFNVPQFGFEQKFNEDEKYHKVAYVEFDSKPDVKMQADLKNRHGFDTKGWSDFILNHRYRPFFNMIKTIVQSSINKRSSTKIAIIAHKNNMVAALAEDIQKAFPDKTVGIFTSLVKKDKEKQLEKDIIISTERSLNKAIDIRGLEVFICTSQFSSEVLAEQMIGRLRREGDKPCLYFDVTDVGFSSCRNQKKSRKKILDLKATETFALKF